MLDRVRNDEEFSSIEGLELINMPRYCTENQAEAVKLICKELPKLKINDHIVKDELIYSMQCMIHKYAKKDGDIIKLEEMSGLKQVIKDRSPVLDSMKREGLLQGIEEGMEKGRKEGLKEGLEKGRKEGTLNTLNKLVNNPDNIFNLEELAHEFGYTVDEIINGK